MYFSRDKCDASNKTWFISPLVESEIHVYIYMYITRETRILKIRSKNYKRNKISSNDEIWSINEPKSVIRSYFLSRYEKFFSPFSRV